LLDSGRIARIDLDEYPMPADPPFGLGILQLVTASEKAAFQPFRGRRKSFLTEKLNA
jgi:hypothetical protein